LSVRSGPVDPADLVVGCSTGRVGFSGRDTGCNQFGTVASNSQSPKRGQEISTMNNARHGNSAAPPAPGLIARSWALVLAAGDGTRLRALTTDRHGVATPKQFCSLAGDDSLLTAAVRRAQTLVPEERVAIVVAADHRRWWRSQTAATPRALTIVQPCNRGTAAGILLPLLAIAEQDPLAQVVVVPSDHFVAHENVLANTTRQALAAVAQGPENLVLLGISPDVADSDYGWILPGDALPGGLRRVRTFVEKPSQARAAQLRAAGGTWNSFLFAARVATLLELYSQRQPALLGQLRWALERPGRRLAAVYRELPTADFSRDLLQGSEDRLRVLHVPPCGWSDLGTPERVAACIEQVGPQPSRRREPIRFPRSAILSLAPSLRRQQSQVAV
jgi:mannose-1-phosphate guanylyltransferase